MHKIYALCLALVLFAACSESPGNPSLTFSGIDSPGLKLDEKAPVFFDVVETDVSVPDATLPDAGLTDAESDTESDTESDVEEDASPEDVGPDVTPECASDEDCVVILGEETCKVAVCTDAGACAWENAPNEQPCDDGDECTYSEACTDGECEGIALDCGVDNPCVLLECQSDKGCVDTGKAEGTVCDDGDACTGNDLCTEGECTGEPVCECESNEDCVDDGNVCNGTPVCENNVCVIDQGTVILCEAGSVCVDISCNPETGACEEDKLTGKACDPGNCLQDGACQEGACAGAPVVCDDANVCTTDACDADTGLCTFTGQSNVDCDDGEVCTLQDGCVDGVCQGGSQDDCNDDKPCTQDSCTPGVGCEYAQVVCNDDDLCTDDACNAGEGCAFTPVTCDDGDACTDDACDSNQGCVTTPITCDDGDACTNDSCSAETGCVFEATGCDDGDACTVDSCDADGGCTYEALDCEDGNACTLEKCEPATGCKFEAVDCTDDIACTTDSCDEATGCVFEPVVCPAGGDCSESSCDEASGECVTKAIEPGAACNDGDDCTAEDSCIDGACVGKILDCDDGNECTADSCNGTDCVFTPADGLSCDEDNPCTILGSCSEGQCEVVDACDDFDDCTLDACSADGECSYEPNPECIDPQCEDKVGGDTCDDGDEDTSADMCIGGQCTGFAYNSVGADVQFGSMSFDEVGHANGLWTVALTTFGSQFDAAALIDITSPEAPVIVDGSTVYGPVYTSIHGRFAVTSQGDLYELNDAGAWSADNAFNDLLADSGIGSLQDIYSVEDAAGTTFWVAGRDGNEEYIRRCTDAGCDEQFLVWEGFGNSPPLPRAITGYKSCFNGECFDQMELGVDQGGGFSYVSHVFGNKDGKQDEWPNTFFDPGPSQDQTQDIAAYGDGRFLVVGNNGYMRYHNGTAWQNAIGNLPGNEASRTFTGVWIGSDVVMVSAWRVSGTTVVLELWTTSKEADPQDSNAWTIHTLDSVYGQQAGAFDVWGLDSGSVMIVGSGRQTWNGFQQGLIYSRQ